MNTQTIMILENVAIAFAAVFSVVLSYFLLYEQRKEKKKLRNQKIAEVVIYPFITSLEKQKSFLKEENFGWRQSGDIRYIVKLASFEDVEKPIYDEFKKDYSKITANIEKYDKEVEKLKENLNKFVDKIKSLSDFENKIGKILGTYTDKNIREILEFIVNKRRELGGANFYHELWNSHRKEFLEFRERTEVKNYKIGVERRRKNLLELAETILGDLKDIRR